MDMNKVTAAREQLEAAMINYARVTRDDEQAPNMFLEDWVCVVVTEDMREGQSAMSHFNFIAPNGNAKYVIRGLLDEAMHYYGSTTRTIDG